jgi:peptide-methionine (R)-S-oxide reductase
MKRRSVLGAGAAIGSAWILTTFTNRAKTYELGTMTTSNEQFTVNKTEEEWRSLLTPEQFRVLRKHGTERAGTSPLDKTYEAGIYKCSGCGTPLFTSDKKFDSGTGWPSFFDPIEGAIATTVDRSLFMTRVEVHCATCGGHLGHVFPDGPAPTGQRYCMNGVSLEFVPQGS